MGGQQAFQTSKQRKKQVQDARYEMYVNKVGQAQSVKGQLREDQQRKQMFDMQDQEAKQMKRANIKQMIEKSKSAQQDFANNRRVNAMVEGREKINYEKQLIYKYEREAQQLEQEEEALIGRL